MLAKNTWAHVPRRVTHGQSFFNQIPAKGPRGRSGVVRVLLLLLMLLRRRRGDSRLLAGRVRLRTAQKATLEVMVVLVGVGVEVLVVVLLILVVSVVKGIGWDFVNDLKSW